MIVKGVSLRGGKPGRPFLQYEDIYSTQQVFFLKNMSWSKINAMK